ncbi:MAG TPA: phenylalanine--tRNA ligase subunit beta [Candidatus Methylomirabilis sp.]|nr:phenylalanine--tRNA ligase subunit beta [Candidatus Methylomirabilis sp.]
MRVPMSWLKEYVDVPLAVAELAERLTLAGLEVSSIQTIGLPGSPLPWDPERILVGQIQEVRPHPSADRLVLATVDYGAAQPKTVVTGAPNLRVGESGQKVPFALEGARHWDGYAATAQVATLKGRKVRGVFSDAMILSEKELGLSDDHTGVLILAASAPAGVPLATYLGDVVLDVEITPNMARCMSVLGVAREVAALTGGRVRPPRVDMQATGASIDGQVDVAISDPSLCARYAATLIVGVSIGPSPEWMRRRLRLAGVRPINNVVDVTNYVMLEWGQPLHAFDYDVLVRRAKGVPQITVRPARPGEILTTLDGVTRPLGLERLLITDTAGPIAVAGVMGGAETEVTPTTTRILLEAANFNFVSIRKTTQALKLPSEASARFGRGVPPSAAGPAAMRATELMRTLGGGEIARGVVDCYPAPQAPSVVTLTTTEIRRILGMELPRAEVERVLTSLEFRCEPVGETGLLVTAPDHRLDIGTGVVGAADIIEEVARITGYDRIPMTEMADTLPPQRDNLTVDLEERVRDLLVGAGLQEVITYRLTTPEREAALLPGQGQAAGRLYVTLTNPISADRVVMRQSLLPGLLEVVAQNARLRDRLWFFEVGPVFLPQDASPLPAEPRKLGIGMAGCLAPASWQDTTPARTGFFELKGVVDSILQGLHLHADSLEPISHPGFVPGRTARLSVGGREVGVLGEIHPDVRKAFDLPAGPICLAELDLDALLARVSLTYRVSPVPRFPPALQDIALVVDEEVSAAQVLEMIRSTAGALLAEVRLFDVYRGKQVPAGKKSLAFSLAFQAMDRTLTDAEVEAEKRRILDAATAQIGARLRE